MDESGSPPHSLDASRLNPNLLDFDPTRTYSTDEVKAYVMDMKDQHASQLEQQVSARQIAEAAAFKLGKENNALGKENRGLGREMDDLRILHTRLEATHMRMTCEVEAWEGHHDDTGDLRYKRFIRLEALDWPPSSYEITGGDCPFKYANEKISRLEGHVDHWKENVAPWLAMSKRLEDENATLCENRRLGKILGRVRTDVRMRFVQQAKVMRWKDWTGENIDGMNVYTKYEPCQAIIDIGNIAAHGGYIVADKALLNL